MEAIKHYYPTIIKETFLDTFGHMNHAMYLVLFEEARWDLITKNGYGLQKIKETGLGPTILEVQVRYLRELKERDEIMIETVLTSVERKIMKIAHRMLRKEELVCTAELTLGFFSLKERKLIEPTQEWLQAIGYKI